ncbi:hypothetical protein BC938DRAFT_478725 [Jimgerdemannia flammicorona]|uniref:Uncharacterized protein n=1 Tax=Jimgerdemannia flammicorona TaxID=994334 RepID=A0A433QMF3_9FUNG|nr:hypothetical protein BC938DRAFT_478725 [Jimgerdemannia flammicorona]
MKYNHLRNGQGHFCTLDNYLEEKIIERLASDQAFSGTNTTFRIWLMDLVMPAPAPPRVKRMREEEEEEEDYGIKRVCEEEEEEEDCGVKRMREEEEEEDGGGPSTPKRVRFEPCESPPVRTPTRSILKNAQQLPRRDQPRHDQSRSPTPPILPPTVQEIAQIEKYKAAVTEAINYPSLDRFSALRGEYPPEDLMKLFGSLRGAMKEAGVILYANEVNSAILQLIAVRQFERTLRGSEKRRYDRQIKRHFGPDIINFLSGVGSTWFDKRVKEKPSLEHGTPYFYTCVAFELARTLPATPFMCVEDNKLFVKDF